MKKIFNKNGFTLVEILTVFSIIGILAVSLIAIINPAGLVRKAHDATRKADLSRIKTAMEDYYNDNGCFPNQTVIDNYHLTTECGKNSFGSWLPKWPCDPKGNNYILEVETDDQGIVKDCPKWFKIYANLENKNDSNIPANWYSMNDLVLSGNYGVNQVNYGVSSTNINWNSISSVDYSSILPTPTSAPVSGGTNLSNLVVKLGRNTLLAGPTFSSSNLSYSIQLPSIPLNVAITPTIETFGATVTVDSISATSGVATLVLIDSSPKTILIVVTSPDHLTTKTYTIVFSSPPYLADIIIDGVRRYTFVKTNFTYNFSIMDSVTAITATAEDTNSTITVNGNVVQSGIKSQSIPLQIGGNTIEVVVSSTNGSNKYSLNITRPPLPTPSGPYLASISGIPNLVPSFNKTVLNYTSTVPYTTSIIKPMPVAEDTGSIITVNGVEVVSGGKATVNLNIGQNTVNVAVNLGGVSNVYNFVVTRQPPITSEPYLNDVIGFENLTPIFDRTMNSYTAIVANGTSSMKIIPYADSGVTITVNGTVVQSGVKSPALPIQIGANTITVVVTSTNGSNTYSFVVNRAL